MASRLIRLIALLCALLLAVPAYAQADLTALVDALGKGGFPEREAAMNALDTFGLDVRTTFHEIAEATDAPKPNKGFFIRRVA